ncbi:hypothetical protein RHMOL_Rhmol13G0175000 [Rhododendron molle]|uniref:Uncharacterized protein n=1 Tax=Rhododendron molle TaxID=49168 RepID=A0ACC0L7S8_RHOML|nr:hypothetical protein RHMOL_Rhmol13G0175000 [Rhododendron molle]
MEFGASDLGREKWVLQIAASLPVKFWAVVGPPGSTTMIGIVHFVELVKFHPRQKLDSPNINRVSPETWKTPSAVIFEVRDNESSRCNIPDGINGTCFSAGISRNCRHSPVSAAEASSSTTTTPSPCELTQAPSGLAYCDKVVGYGPEAVKGQLIKLIRVGQIIGVHAPQISPNLCVFSEQLSNTLYPLPNKPVNLHS